VCDACFVSASATPAPKFRFGRAFLAFPILTILSFFLFCVAAKATHPAATDADDDPRMPEGLVFEVVASPLVGAFAGFRLGWVRPRA
jgi:hypothetical protein